jgi:peptidyl-prolyl cis-trans isomerase A (cyclophilin A)
MSRLLLISICTCCLVTGCTSGTDDSIPPTMQALNDLQEQADAEANRAIPTEAPELPADVTASGIYQVEFITTEGKFLVEVNREWAPIGADRFYKLVTDGFFDDSGFFRVVPDFVVQFGLPADPAENAKWSKGLMDEPVKQGNKRGYFTFAKSSAPNSRTTQLFISLGDNDRLDGMGFSAFGHVIEGMDVVDKINSEYGERPQQPSIKSQGNAYLHSSFPNLSYVQTARVIKDDLAPATSAE